MSDSHTLRRLDAGNWWQCVVVDEGRPIRVVVVESHAYPDGTRVELTANMARAQILDNTLCAAELDDDGDVVALNPAARFAPKVPDVWFAEVRESTARPPAVSLLAFTGHGLARGCFVKDGDVAELPIETGDQLGAVRWYPATGETDQLYVQPQWRRRNVASALLAAGEALSAARGWPRFWGDGQRTALGEAARNARTWSKRTADLTHLAPPMTPGATSSDADGTPS